MIYAEMVRGTRYVSVKVKTDNGLTSRFYPPAGTYVFHYSISSGKGDWKTVKSYRAGMNLNNPLMPVSVADEISAKSLSPNRSFCSVIQENVVISALKKEDKGSSVILRLYEIEGSPLETSLKFLGNQISFLEINLLEENKGKTVKQTLAGAPYSIKTIKFSSKNTLQ